MSYHFEYVVSGCAAKSKEMIARRQQHAGHLRMIVGKLIDLDEAVTVGAEQSEPIHAFAVAGDGPELRRALRVKAKKVIVRVAVALAGNRPIRRN